MFVLSSSWLPVVVALVALLFALYLKRTTLRNSDLVALVVGAVVLFLVLSGAFNALHLPTIAVRLF